MKLFHKLCGTEMQEFENGFVSCPGCNTGPVHKSTIIGELEVREGNNDAKEAA
ncbi:MAG: hypothetical protein HYZ51_00715 [Candidatus Doudnabacteria bacterium]|nr:hypothetical protein [Candidatus Doudnabacteria bacterium]